MWVRSAGELPLSTSRRLDNRHRPGGLKAAARSSTTALPTDFTLPTAPLAAPSPLNLFAPAVNAVAGARPSPSPTPPAITYETCRSRSPRGLLTCFTGVAGSGKSSLIAEFTNNIGDVGGKVVFVDQRPVGRSSRSNPATYIGIFDAIRQIFADANGGQRFPVQLQHQRLLPGMWQ